MSIDLIRLGPDDSTNKDQQKQKIKPSYLLDHPLAKVTTGTVTSLHVAMNPSAGFYAHCTSRSYVLHCLSNCTFLAF